MTAMKKTSKKLEKTSSIFTKTFAIKHLTVFVFAEQFCALFCFDKVLIVLFLQKNFYLRLNA